MVIESSVQRLKGGDGGGGTQGSLKGPGGAVQIPIPEPVIEAN